MSASEATNFNRSEPNLDRDLDFSRPFFPVSPAEPACPEDFNSLADTDWFPSPFSDISSISRFRDPVWLAVTRLYQAAKLATDCQCERQEFSVSWDELSRMDLRREELKWLLIKNVVKESMPVLDANDRTSHLNNRTDFSSNAMFVIADLGFELVEQCQRDAKLHQSTDDRSSQTSFAQQELKPSWDSERHELRCGTKVVKKFKWRAANQETILATFEEEGWPAHIDDPLPQEPAIDPKRRLADAIKSLNRHQKASVVRFCGDGTGQGVLWELK